MNDNRYRRTADGYVDLDQFPDEELSRSESEFLHHALGLLTVEDRERYSALSLQSPAGRPSIASTEADSQGFLIAATQRLAALLDGLGGRVAYAVVSLVAIVFAAIAVQTAPFSESAVDVPATVQAGPGPAPQTTGTNPREPRGTVTAAGEPPVVLDDVVGSTAVPAGSDSMTSRRGQLVVGGEQGSLFLLDESDLSSRLVLYEGQDDQVIRDVAVLPDGRLVLVGSNGMVRLVDPDASDADPIDITSFRDGNVNAVAVLSSGLVATAGEDGRVLVLDPRRPNDDPAAIITGDVGGVRAIVSLPTGGIAFGGDAGTVTVSEAEGLDQITTSSSFGSSIAAVAVLDGERLAVAVGRDLVIWNHGTGTTIARFSGHELAITDVLVTATGRVISGGADGRVLLWDPTTPGFHESIDNASSDNSVSKLELLNDGRLAVLDSAGAIRIVNVPGGSRWPGAETQVGFFQYVNAARQACETSVGQHGQEVTVNGTRYLVQEAAMLTSNRTDRDGRAFYVGTSPEGNELVIGTAGDDALDGNGGDDILCGFGGDDYLTGRAGNDILIGGDGLDISLADHGPDGQDLIFADGRDFDMPPEQGFPTWGDPPNRDELLPVDQGLDYCFPWKGDNFSNSVGCNQPTPADPSTSAGFAVIVDVATEACRSAIGRHGEQFHFNGTEYLVVELSALEPSNTQDPALPKYLAFDGMEENNLLIGTEAAEGLDVGLGDDIVCAYGGNDAITGGDGNDILIGGTGIDEFIGGAGADLLVGDEEDLRHSQVPLRCDFPSEDGDLDFAVPDDPDKTALCDTPT